MTAVFLYGTLLSEVQRAAVLGADGGPLRPARLAGHAVFWDAAHRFPLIAEATGATAEGGLLEAGPGALARLDAYELPFGYRRRQVTVTTEGGAVEAACYFPGEGAARSDAPWDLATWEARFGEITRLAAAEVMAEAGRADAADLARRYPLMQARAAARLAATEGAPAELRTDTPREAVEERARRRAHAGFFALDVFDVVHPRFDGGREEVRREVFIGLDAALVLPYDPGRDRVLLIEQFRIGPYGRGDPRPWPLEPVAGLVDPGETPEECARREAREEAGVELGRLVPVLRGYPSPGATTEFFHHFIGLCELPDELGGVHGLDHEGEDIRAHVLSLDRALGLAETGEINVVPLAMLLFWLGANRERVARLA